MKSKNMIKTISSKDNHQITSPSLIKILLQLDPGVESYTPNTKSNIITPDRTLNELVNIIRTQFELPTNKKMYDVLQFAIEQLGIESECFNVKSIREKAALIVSKLE